MSTGSLHEINAKKHKLKAGVLTAIITVCILVLCFMILTPRPGNPTGVYHFISVPKLFYVIVLRCKRQIFSVMD